jgi:hypothetical protein
MDHINTYISLIVIVGAISVAAVVAGITLGLPMRFLEGSPDMNKKHRKAAQ